MHFPFFIHLSLMRTYSFLLADPPDPPNPPSIQPPIEWNPIFAPGSVPFKHSPLVVLYFPTFFSTFHNQSQTFEGQLLDPSVHLLLDALMRHKVFFRLVLGFPLTFLFRSPLTVYRFFFPPFETSSYGPRALLLSFYPSLQPSPLLSFSSPFLISRCPF